MLNAKTADDPEAALRALAVEPAWDEADFVKRRAFQLVAFAKSWCGPGEVSQLRCVGIVWLYDKPHFRFAKRSLMAERWDGDGPEDESDTGPGANDAKTKNAFRWIPVYPLLIELGLLRQRDAIVNDYLVRKFSEAGWFRKPNYRRCAAGYRR